MKKILFVLAAIFIAAVSFAQTDAVFIKVSYANAGYDAFAYFTENKAVKGSTDHPLKWKNVVWLFSTKKHADLFTAAPEKYTPQYGGYCVYGCTRGYKAITDTDAFSIVDGKLYFNYNLKTKEVWLKDAKVYIQKADEEWDKIKDQLFKN